MSSVKDDEIGPLLKQVFANSQKKPSPKVVKSLMELAGAANDEHTFVTAIDLATAEADRNEPDRFDAIDALLSGLRRNPHSKDILEQRLDRTTCRSLPTNASASRKTTAPT